MTPAPATVTVGAFPNAAAQARVPEPGRQVEIAGFDKATARAPEFKPSTVTIGAFDKTGAAGKSRPGSEPATDTVVANTGFNRAPAGAPAAPESRVVRETGFGNTNSRDRPRTAEPPAVVAPVAFENARASPLLAKPLPPPPPTIIPLEVLSKPAPAYTDEARKLKIEGEVLLEVEFASTGIVRVLRVVRGLGHGLDDAAVRAAEQIRFKPAQNGGKPVDFRTTVHIVFRLA